MVEYVYKKYEENKGFEEYQAEIYNSVAKKYKGQLVSAEGIKRRLHEHKPKQDPNGITYAFDSFMKPVAYIQYREYGAGKVRIGFPWAKEGTPIEVQDKLFYNLLDYLKKKYPNKREFYLGNVDSIYTDVHDKILNHYHFEIDNWTAFYSIELKKLKNITIPTEISSKVVSINDLDTISEIAIKDPSLASMGITEIKNFFTGRIFNQENSKISVVYIMLKNNNPVATVAISKQKQKDKDYNVCRLIGIIKGEEEIFEILLGLISEDLETKKWNYPISIPLDDTVSYQEKIIVKKGGVFESKAIEYKLKIN